MSLNPLRTVKRMFRNDTVVVLECRRCGTTVTADTRPCSNCGRDCIARYEIE